MSKQEVALAGDPLWYKDAVIYQVHVRSFYDGNGDGIGDFQGLTEKLEYLKDLGVTAVWLLPFYPSPLKDDGYDIADYFDVHPDYGTLRDFKTFLNEAHRADIRVITELVLNHTSDQHRWFQRARRAQPGSLWRDFYVWNDTPEKYKEARIIFGDFENSNWAWDPVARAYYWHRFYSHQPDLNYENTHVQKAMVRVMEWWLGMGVDGMRLDAIPYLYEREGTSCENLPETYTFLQRLRQQIDGTFQNRMLLAEANQWPEDAASYFGKGDACHMAFHFPLMPRIFMAVQMEERFPIVDILEQTPSIPENCQWAIFLRNHDELTLEMVTDEERDYMYRSYARDRKMRINGGIRRRLAPLLENDRRKIELMNALLFSLPGTPVIYYGDEIGMGDNYHLGDRNGVRTPMQWNGDRNAGFSKAHPQKLTLPVIIDPEYRYEAVNVENQEENQSSLLWNMKRFIAIRKQHPAFGRGSMTFLFPENPKVLAFIREYKEEKILMVVNLSRHSQIANLDLSNLAGYFPETLFSRSRFPPIKEGYYPITLGPYGYYRFLLRREEEGTPLPGKRLFPEVAVQTDWKEILEEKGKNWLERQALPSYLQGCRWFAGKADQIERIEVMEAIRIGKDDEAGRLLFLKVEYVEGVAEIYLLPLSFAQGEGASRMTTENPKAIIGRLKIGQAEGVLYDGVYNPAFRDRLLTMLLKRQKPKGDQGELTPFPTKRFKEAAGEAPPWPSSRVLEGEETNTTLLYGESFRLKLYRRLDEGVHPEVEIGRFLTEEAGFPHVPPFSGTVEYTRPGAPPIVIALLQGFVPNQGDAWRYSVDVATGYLERVLSKRKEVEALPETPPSLLESAFLEIPPLLRELIGSIHLEMAALLGKRTAEFHLALASNAEDPNFTPEPYTLLYQRSSYQAMQSRGRQVFQLLRKNLNRLSDAAQQKAREILDAEGTIIDRLKRIYRKQIATTKIRIHGDYHLGQVLYTGNDFCLVDFEGDPTRPLSERRIKRSPFRDVAGMIRSFHYKAHTGLIAPASVRPEDIPVLEPWADLWFTYTAGAFFRAYLHAAEGASFLPKNREEIAILLDTFLLDKAIGEIADTLNRHPEWTPVALRGIGRLLEIPA